MVLDKISYMIFPEENMNVMLFQHLISHGINDSVRVVNCKSSRKIGLT